MSRSDDQAGIGCCGLIAALVLLGLILEYWLQILLVGTLAGAVVLLAMHLTAAAQRAGQRRRCAVCQSWSGSVLLTELEAAGPLCPAHKARKLRIAELEDDVLD